MLLVATSSVNSFFPCRRIIAGSWLFPGSTIVDRRNMRLEGIGTLTAIGA
jgi:hypothetical protein